MALFTMIAKELIEDICRWHVSGTVTEPENNGVIEDFEDYKNNSKNWEEFENKFKR